jgi:histidinol dehydrogenase
LWHTSTDAALIPGSNHRSIGSIIRLVLTAVNAEVERIKIKTPHKTTGTHAPSGAGSDAPCDKDFAAGI